MAGLFSFTLQMYIYNAFSPPLARKERSISKESIVGFIVDYDEVLNIII